MSFGLTRVMLRRSACTAALGLLFLVAHCSSAPPEAVGASHQADATCGTRATAGTDCSGNGDYWNGASCCIPNSGDYYLTSFGYSSDSGQMSCGENTNHGSWYYAASRQRYGCGAHIRIEANGRCAVAETDDYGAANWVEGDAGGPILDASPLVSELLFGQQSAGWSQHLGVHVTVVDRSTPLGACQSQSGWSCGDSQGGNGKQYWTCSNGTLNRCDNGGHPKQIACSHRCSVGPALTDDQCNWSCGDSRGSDGNQYWTCQSGVIYECDANGIPVQADCGGGCVEGPALTDDKCLPSGGSCNATLIAGQVLYATEMIHSCDGRFWLTMQGDGNFVLYEGSHPLWASNTSRSDAAYAIMQNDGNVVLYNWSGTPRWASHTAGHPGSYLALQNDGNVVVYQGPIPLWASNTCCR